MKIFWDANVWIAAILSPQGGSAELLRKIAKNDWIIYISKEVIAEVTRNLQKKASSKDIEMFFNLYQVLRPQIVDFIIKDKIRASQVVNSKDAKILAAALKSQCHYLVTLDRKHFFTSQVKEFCQPIKIVTPGDLLKKNNRSF